MRDIWGASMVSDINQRNIAQIFGEKVYCIGAEKINQVTKLRGSEIKFCYVDEAVDIHKEVFEMLKSRLSLPYSVCHGACNPSYPSHYIKEFIDSKEKGVDVYCQEYTIYDNPFLPKEYVHGLEAEYAGTVYFQRYILGKWARAEGLIYPMYLNVFADPIDEPTEYALSIDYGTQNPLACLLWEKHGNIWYATRGYYYSGRETGEQKTDEEYGNDLDKFIADIIAKRNAKYLQTGIPQPKIKTIIDPSAASFIALLKKKSWCSVIPADNAVLDGIRNTASAMQLGYIKISPSIKDWRREVEGYVWDDSIYDERPIKEEDHYMDATRYFVKTMRIVEKHRKPDYKPIWNKEVV
jgi:PBSX family phage terminase large subunit